MRRSVLTAPALLALVALPLPAHAQETARESADVRPQVTPQQLAESVRRLDPEGSVVRFSLAGSVTPLESERADGTDTVLALDTDLLFAFASAELTPAAVTRVPELVADLPQGSTVAVTGHTDGIGDDAANQRLSEQRAEAVAAHVRAARPDLVLDVQGRGESEPLAPETVGGEDDPRARQQNRRVELRYDGGGTPPA